MNISYSAFRKTWLLLVNTQLNDIEWIFFAQTDDTNNIVFVVTDWFSTWLHSHV